MVNLLWFFYGGLNLGFAVLETMTSVEKEILEL